MSEMIKKALSLVIASALVVSAASCSSRGSENQSEQSQQPAVSSAAEPSEPEETEQKDEFVKLPISDELRPQGSELIQFGESMDYQREFVQAYYNNGMLRVDFGNPGLNSSQIATVIYSLNENKEISRTDMPVSMFDSGIYNYGYYNVVLPDAEIELYDFDGNKTGSIIPDINSKGFAFAQLSDDGKDLVYGDAADAIVYYYSVADDARTQLWKFFGYVKDAGYNEKGFYIKNSMGDLMHYARGGEYLESLMVDDRLNLLTPYYSVGTTEDEFIAVDSEDGMNPKYIKFVDRGEVAITSFDEGFITYMQSDDYNETLRVYNVKQGTRFEIPLECKVRQIEYLEDGLMLIIAEEKNKPGYSFYIARTDSENAKSVEVNNESTADILDAQEWKDSYEMTDVVQEGQPEDGEDAESKAESESESKPESKVESKPESKAESKPESKPEKKSSKKVIADVPILSQMPEYPTGCEATSTVMLLKYLGEKITVSRFIDNYLDCSTDFYTSGDQLYGPDPNEQFVGNPRTSSGSYGCMSPVIKKALKKYYGDSAKVKKLSGVSMDELCSKYIDKDIPVLVWVSINMKKPYYTRTWRTPSGEDYTWLAREHCMLLVGYDDDCYYFNDPWAGKQMKYEKELSKSRYKSFDKQAVVVIK